MKDYFLGKQLSDHASLSSDEGDEQQQYLASSTDRGWQGLTGCERRDLEAVQVLNKLFSFHQQPQFQLFMSLKPISHPFQKGGNIKSDLERECVWCNYISSFCEGDEQRVWCWWCLETDMKFWFHSWLPFSFNIVIFHRFYCFLSISVV